MKLKITEPVMIAGEGFEPGDVVEVTESQAFNVIHTGRGVPLTEAEEIEHGDPVPENREPKPKRRQSVRASERPEEQ